ncbi:MAG TPA: helix-turn-helix transcriptional regulator [Pirellulales bacterium]|nr:helix-turn-helix transcriptional regulator [Pirellulales bacterium]
MLGEAVRSIRKSRGMTQADLAKAIGVAANTVAILERGERAFSLKTLNALGKALDMPAACLAVLGSPSSSAKNPAASQVVAKLQALITTTMQVEQRQKKSARHLSKKRAAATNTARVA